MLLRIIATLVARWVIRQNRKAGLEVHRADAADANNKKENDDA